MSGAGSPVSRPLCVTVGKARGMSDGWSGEMSPSGQYSAVLSKALKAKGRLLDLGDRAIPSSASQVAGQLWVGLPKAQPVAARVRWAW